ncbi:MAG: UDP-N-acetylmuramate--L-alanine ligase [Firmicutes bacterium]|nr:UDP-N-acetylmuramate--L-alanine ligase [Bacillota bacterium]
MFKDKIIHFIGIGGISMSGIAEILNEKGVTITGSDSTASKTTRRLTEKGINIVIGEDPTLVEKADIVVYTAAISEENAELQKAHELGKELYERAKFLGLMTKDYKHVICISGTHGKSTTTGMVASCFLEDHKNPTIQIGAFLPKINSNYYVGDNEYFIMEACEYVDSFLSFYPTSEIILNIDDDHLDYFGNIENVKKSFSKYTHLLPQNGNLVLNADDANTMDIEIPKNTKVLTYAINNDAIVKAHNISYDEFGHPKFDIYYNNELYIQVKLSVLGNHNIYNALATTCMCILHNVSKNAIINGLNEYIGVERRFQFLGTYNENVLVYDDYAHHPTEIASTLNSVKTIKCNQNWAIFQSHTFSRTKEHLEEFANILKEFDNVIIAPIYPAREINIFNIKEEDIVNLIKPHNKNVHYIESFDKIVDYLKDNLKTNDLVITIGAGPVNEIGNKLVK